MLQSWVDAYLGDRFRDYVAIACRRGIKMVHLPYRFQSVRVIDACGHELKLAHGDTSYSLVVTDVIFCPGLGAPRLPDLLKPHIGHPRLIFSPYPEADMLRRIGGKLSAVDAVVLLGRQDCKVSMQSPSDALPAVRSRSIRKTLKNRVFVFGGNTPGFGIHGGRQPNQIQNWINLRGGLI